MRVSPVTKVCRVFWEAGEGMAKAGLPSPTPQEVGTSTLGKSAPSWPRGQTGGFSGTLQRGGLLSGPSVFLRNYFIPGAPFQLHNFPERTLNRR